MINKLRNFLYSKYVRYFRKYIRISSYPYISGDSFRKISNHVLDEVRNINIKEVKKNDLIFVKTDYLDVFFNDIFPKLNDFFTLLTHNSDYSIDKKYIEIIGKKNFRWFAQNLNFSTDLDNRFYPLPIGLENRSYLKHGKIKNFNLPIIKKNKKFNRIYCSFNVLTNKERIEVLKIANQNNLVDFTNFANHKNYILNLNQYKFNICPEGNGLDTHRFWESLMVNTLPIVKNSEFISNFVNLEIPMLVLNNWNELKNLDEITLNKFYDSKYNQLIDSKSTSLDFWHNKL